MIPPLIIPSDKALHTTPSALTVNDRELSNLAHTAADQAAQQIDSHEEADISEAGESTPKSSPPSKSAFEMEMPNPLHSTHTDTKGSQRNSKSDTNGNAPRNNRFGHIKFEVTIE